MTEEYKINGDTNENEEQQEKKDIKTRCFEEQAV